MKLLVIISEEDRSYLARFSNLIDGHKASVYRGKIDSYGQLDILAKRINADAVVTTRQDIIALESGDKKAKVSDFIGSVLDTPLGREVLVLPPLKWLVRVSYGEWLMSRYLSKLLTPERWYAQSPFTYKVLRNERDYQEFKELFDSAFLCAIDIETREPNIIRSVSYTLKFPDESTKTGVFQLNSMDSVRWMRTLNEHPIVKVCQNGKYECAYFFAWSAPMTNYVGDTLSAMHATWSELPKTLEFVASVFLRKYRYWKDMRAAEDTDTQLEYNALDTWSTCEAFCSWLQEAPEYARTNYVMKWPQIILSHEMEMRGLKRDPVRKEKWRKVYTRTAERQLAQIRTMVGVPEFNPASPKQCLALLRALTNKDWPSSDEAHLVKVSNLHPLNSRILGAILEYRGLVKLMGTYLGDKDFKGRWLYTINPTGTDTGRDASKAHHFWTGQNIQNVPNEHWQIKNTVLADEGYELWEADYSQAEARGVAYSSGDSALLAAVESHHDFHSLNASAFFGLPYEEIYDDETGKVLNKPIRNLSKRTNHGANYNMGPAVMLATMGEKRVREAKKLLNLPRQWTLLKVCEHLLNVYEITYPRVKTAYYKKIVKDVRLYSKLVGATGWTRYCFGSPWANKLDLNSYVAHVTQSLNAMVLDEAARRIFRWRLEEGLLNIVKVNAKIHDSILFQTPIGRRDLAEKLRDKMRFPVPVTDCMGVERSMIVPVDLKLRGRRWESYQ